MVILLDTHIAYWVITNSPKLSSLSKLLLSSSGNDFYISQASIWEVEIKHEKHPELMPFSGQSFLDYCTKSGIRILPLKNEHIFEIRNILNEKIDHKDPFDQILMASASFERISFMTADSKIKKYQLPFVIYVGD